jgi:hypothetical protein
MAEDKLEPRELNLRQWFPWTLLLRSFWIAADYKKLLLAAAGILGMAFGWWLLAVIFSLRHEPEWASGKFERWEDFESARRSWNLLYEAAGPKTDPPKKEDANDLAHNAHEFDVLAGVERSGKSDAEIRQEIASGKLDPEIANLWLERRVKAAGRLRTWPWFEPRGPNPFLLITGRSGDPDAVGTAHYVPWHRGEFFDWFLGVQVPVLIEPLVKFLHPVFYFLNANADSVDRVYFLLVIIWTVGVWAVFGGAITRIAAVEVARNEKIALREALRYAIARWQSYVFASFAPLLGLACFVILLILFGVGNLIPGFAELWDGLLWWVCLGIGLVMAVLLIGLVGWPLIHATLSTEGSDSFDALSRSYSYVLQKPWNYLWNVLVALVYGAIVVFFVGLMGSLAVYLSKWGVSLIAPKSRDPSYLFTYAPTSFGWRDLLLQGSKIAEDQLHWWNSIGAILVAFWLYLAFLCVIGFGYSYFWSASTIIYLLMRQKVDDTDLDEVYLEEEDLEEPYTTPGEPGTSVPPAPSGLQMVESPSLRTSAGSAPKGPEAKAEESPSPGDGNPPPAGSAPP